jgi:hypothetical protein
MENTLNKTRLNVTKLYEEHGEKTNQHYKDVIAKTLFTLTTSGIAIDISDIAPGLEELYDIFE